MSDSIFRQVLDLIGNNEDAALEAFAAVAHKFGWAGPIYTRLDVTRLWEQMYPGVPFTDERWERVRSHPQWSGLHDAMRTECWMTIEDILKEVGPDADAHPDGEPADDSPKH